MSDFIKFNIPGTKLEALQSILEARRQARSLENSVDALIPLLSNKEVAEQFEGIRAHAEAASRILQQFYKSNARETFGPEQEGTKANG